MFLGHLVAVVCGGAGAVLLGPGVVAGSLGAVVGVGVMVLVGRLHVPAVASAVVVGMVGSFWAGAGLMGGVLVVAVMGEVLGRVPVLALGGGGAGAGGG